VKRNTTKKTVPTKKICTANNLKIRIVRAAHGDISGGRTKNNPTKPIMMVNILTMIETLDS